jgi:hypothetical protein
VASATSSTPGSTRVFAGEPCGSNPLDITEQVEQVDVVDQC